MFEYASRYNYLPKRLTSELMWLQQPYIRHYMGLQHGCPRFLTVHAGISKSLNVCLTGDRLHSSQSRGDTGLSSFMTVQQLHQTGGLLASRIYVLVTLSFGLHA
jgi:hypothetical protein